VNAPEAPAPGSSHQFLSGSYHHVLLSGSKDPAAGGVESHGCNKNKIYKNIEIVRRITFNKMIRVVHNNRGRKDENLRNSNTHSSSSQLIVSLFNGFGTNGGPITILWEEAQALCAPEKGLSQQYGTQVGVANRILYVQGHYLDSVALRSLITQRGSP